MAGGAGGAVARSVVVRVREARAADLPARAALLRDAYADHNVDAFLLFFFQEATLEGVVLCGAVLFIFCGASPAACALLLPAAAALVALAVRLHHAHLAHRHAQRMAKEWGGWVAEVRGPAAGPPPGAAVRVAISAGAAPGGDAGAARSGQVVGTASVWRERGGYGGYGAAEGRLGALCVARGWRRRGAGGALADAARAGAARGGCGCGGGGGGGAGLARLHAHVSELQGAARALLVARGWRCAGAGPVRPPGPAGALLTLQVAHLVTDLPHA